MWHKKKFNLIYFLLFISIFLTSCGLKSEENTAATRKAFSQYTNDLFIREVQSDSITLNYTLSSPENYGITDFIPTLGEYSIASSEEALVDSENQLAKLSSFKYSFLTQEQKLTYDILEYLLEDNLSFDENFILYPEVLSPTLGIQSQLPVLLAEYNFYSKDDIEDYLELLPSIKSYYEDIVEYEKDKAASGLFMSENEAETVIAQCNSFIAEPENNLLITVFNERIENYPELTAKEKATYKKTNKKNVIKYVIPAYENLIDCLTNLKGSGVNDGGLYNFPKGKEYYQKLVKSNTGSSKSVEEMIKLLNSTIRTNIKKIQNISAKDKGAVQEMLNVKYDLTKPEEILDYLEEAIQKNYPAMEDVNYTVKYVDKSLEEYLSPAFYLTPPLDSYNDNRIYINKSPQFDLSSLFTTLAHEGYPGHLYQSVFYNQQNPEPIRSIFNFSGYSEGWATYVEIESYSLAGFPSNVTLLLQLNKAATLALYARVDIGIHYEGWDYKKTSAYLEQLLGITDKDVVSSFYNAIIEDPANYLKYTMGYLEFKELREKAEKKLGKSFNLKNFHEFILKTGPVPFEILEDRMDNWMKTQK